MSLDYFKIIKLDDSLLVDMMISTDYMLMKYQESSITNMAELDVKFYTTIEKYLSSVFGFRYHRYCIVDVGRIKFLNKKDYDDFINNHLASILLEFKLQNM